MFHVLIIEDEALIALDLQEMLADHGATSFAFAETEKSAIEAAKLRKPDLITSDIRLKCGTGLKAVSVIEENLGPLPVLFITATPDACGSSRPAFSVLGKPLDKASIFDALKQLVPDMVTH